MTRIIRNLVLACLLFVPAATFAQNPYRWTDELELLKSIDRLPEYRTGSYVESFSSYDRKHGNDDGFDGTYSFIRKEGGKLVLAEMQGPGVIDRIWTPTPNDNMLYFYFDGKKEPSLKLKFSDLFSGKVYPFIKPLCSNEVGGFFCYVPITYAKSCKIVYDGPKLEFIQIEYRNLKAKRVETFPTSYSPADKELLQSVASLWSRSSYRAELFAGGLSAGAETTEKSVTIHPGEEVDIFQSDKGGRITGFEIDGGTAFEGLNKDILLSARWDNDPTEAIYAPLADFFGYAYGKPAMRSMLLGRQQTANYCYLPMPFDASAHLSLVYKKRNTYQPTITAKIKVHYTSNRRIPSTEGKFYSVWRSEQTPIGSYHTFLHTKGKGHYVGTILSAQGLRPGMTLFFEGDDSTFIDNKMRIHGTGSEDYFNGGWYALLDRWDRGISLPLHGALDYSLPMARTGGYRFFLSDKMAYENEIYHGMEHGGQRNDFPVAYTSLAFFYSDTPPVGKMEPTESLRTVYLPKTHIYFPQLFNITLGSGIIAIFGRALTMETPSTGTVRLQLDDVPEGKYKLLLNYMAHPRGADVEIWQRQKQLSNRFSTSSDKQEEKKSVYIGDIDLTAQTNSITFHVKKNGNGNRFDLTLVTLERIE